jgi:hypothetical protein
MAQQENVMRIAEIVDLPKPLMPMSTVRVDGRGSATIGTQ